MGRSSLIMVISFNLVFAAIGFNLSKVATDAYDNYIDYYNRTVVRHIATGAANMAASQITFNPNWRTGYSTTSFGGGSYKATVADLDSGRIQLVVNSTYNNKTATSTLVLGLSKFSKFAYYSNIEGAIYWITGDTVFGPFHTQQKINVSGDPVFVGKATTKNGIFKSPSSSSPKFLGGYQGGVSINLPSDFSQLSSFAKAGGKYVYNQDMYLRFNSDGTVTYRFTSWSTAPAYTEPISVFAPNGVLMVDNGNLHIKGNVNGRLTISATGSSGVAKGNVWVDSSVTYNLNPLTNSVSTDMLGIVCDNDVIVADNGNNNTPLNGVTIHATILSRSGGLKAENYNTRPVGGTLTLLGGVQQYQRGPVGTFSGGSITHGFQKNYRYDDRLMIDSPPLYPTTGGYEVLSWYEQ